MNRIQLLIGTISMTLSLGGMQKTVSLSQAGEQKNHLDVTYISSEPAQGNVTNTGSTLSVEIVDQATKDSLADSIVANRPTYIFGATPRYAIFVRFIDVLVHHLNLLNEHYERSRKLKCVSSEIKALFAEFKMKNPAINPADTLRSLSLRDKMKLFFVLGFQQKRLKDNFHDLCVTISKHAKHDQVHLIHALLPCYLDGCTELYRAHTSESGLEQDDEIRPLTDSKLRLFLQESALFYKGMYEQSAENSMTVHLVIPKVSYFDEMAQRVKQGPLTIEEKEESIGTFLRKEILGHTILANSPLVIVNQNSEEIGSLIHLLLFSNIDRSMLDGLYLSIRTGVSLTTVFNPYTVNVTAGNDDNYAQSSLIKKELLPFLLRGMNNAVQ